MSHACVLWSIYRFIRLQQEPSFDSGMYHHADSHTRDNKDVKISIQLAP